MLRLIYLWATKTRAGQIVDDLKLSHHTVIDWLNLLRDVCTQYFIDHPLEIGGPGAEVEIDESKFGRRKFHRGRYVEGHWVFGGVERGTGKAFVVEVPSRDAATLLPIIRRHIRHGTRSFSDEWRAYNAIQAQAGANYDHRTVNHSRYFVDPNNDAHTQNVEASCKRLFRSLNVMPSRLLDTYFSEYMWRRQFDKGGSSAFWNMIEHINEQYPL